MTTACSGTVTDMERTQADRARRRCLADAAAGVGIQRAQVVLYACLPSGGPDKVLAEMRGYADARDWVVAAELIDQVPIGEPTDGRPQWATLKGLIESQHAQGIVTPTRRMCGLRDPEQIRLNTWLAVNHAFIASVWTAEPVHAGGVPPSHRP